MRKIIEKLGFASHFCDYVLNLIQKGQASVIVNGFISESFEIHRGIRQGDPLSLHPFLLFLEPILKKINEDVHREGISLPGSKRTIVKYFACADDVTFIMADVRSVNLMLHLFKEYKSATGIALNMEKLNGLIVKESCQAPPDLLFINWNNEFINILNVPFGDSVAVKQLFKKKN